MIMQAQLERVAHGEKDRSLGETKIMKQAMKVAEMRMSELNELNAEVGVLKELLSNSKDELKQRDGKIKCLEIELEHVRKLETELASRDSLIDMLRQELNSVRESECRVKELEAEVERGKLSECKMLELLQQQMKLLEDVKIELEEAKQKKVNARDVNEPGNEESFVPNAEAGSLKDELALVKNELELVKDELKLATGAEETSKKAMDELALALTEVATGSNLEKEKHGSVLLELEHVKDESEQLKKMLWSTEEKYQKLLDEAKKESELHRNTADRLRVEAEESLLAWNGKEMGFVTCIKTAEKEKAVVQHEKAKLAETLKTTETLTKSAREENLKLRDILKQAINEANAAKAAAGIARDENSLLKDSLSEKDEALLILHKENEHLRINEVAANENLKEFKQLLSSASMELKIGDKETTTKLKSSISNDEHDEKDNEDEDEDDDKEEENVGKKTFSFDLDELKVKDEDSTEEATKQEDPEKEHALKGSIFDNDYTPKDEPHTPMTESIHQRGYSIPFVVGEGSPNSEDHDADSHQLYDPNCDRNNGRKNNKKLFRRVSDIIMRKKMIQ